MSEKPLSATEATALALAIDEAVEQAAISGLCRDGQMEIAMQTARRLCPDLDDESLRELVEIETGTRW